MSQELTHVIGKGALEPVEDKPALLPRFDLAAHLDQVAAADLARSRSEEGPTGVAPRRAPWSRTIKAIAYARASGGCAPDLFRPAPQVPGRRPLVLVQELGPLFRGPRRCPGDGVLTPAPRGRTGLAPCC